jgi:hypothetical protein
MRISGVLTVLAAFLLPLLASCGTYRPPAGATARMKFIGSKGYAYIDYGNSCRSRQSVEGEFLNGAPIRDGVRVWIEHGFDVVDGLGGYKRCSFTYSFIPSANTTYVSEFTLQNITCTISVRRLSDSDPGESVLAVVRERDLNCEGGVPFPVLR